MATISKRNARGNYARKNTSRAARAAAYAAADSRATSARGLQYARDAFDTAAAR